MAETKFSKARAIFDNAMVERWAAFDEAFFEAEAIFEKYVSEKLLAEPNSKLAKMRYRAEGMAVFAQSLSKAQTVFKKALVEAVFEKVLAEAIAEDKENKGK